MKAENKIDNFRNFVTTKTFQDDFVTATNKSSSLLRGDDDDDLNTQFLDGSAVAAAVTHTQQTLLVRQVRKLART